MPPAVVRDMVPVVLPEAGVAVTVVEFTFVNEAAAVPLNFTAVVPVRFVPVIVTRGRLPEQPEVGVKLVMVGTCASTDIWAIDSTKSKQTRTMTDMFLACLFIYCSFIYPPVFSCGSHETKTHFFTKSKSTTGWVLIKYRVGVSLYTVAAASWSPHSAYSYKVYNVIVLKHR